ncbi:MAG: ATP-binding protein [Treponema sp.]|nr:ATP-binding protein [Treponema sp.]
MMYFQRHLETVVNRISKRKPVIVLTGARQVGKSTMLKTSLKGVNYIAMDMPPVRESAINEPSLFFERYKPPVIIDEIQKAAGLFEYIKDSADTDRKKGQFYLTGSQSLALMKNISESLAGRAGVIKMLGLSMRELGGITHRAPFIPSSKHIADMSKPAAAFSYEAVINRIHKGFFPELYETKSDLHDWSDYYSSYLQTYIEKDIRDVLQIQDESAFLKFVRMTAALTGQMLNLSAIADSCGKDSNTIRRWLSVMESSGLVFLLKPYYNNLNKRLIKTPKLYFLDTGLACWLLGWNTPQQLANGAMWGHIFESFVVAEILKSYYNDGIVDVPLYYYRDKDKNEIDMIIQNGNTLHPVEIKATGNPQKSMISSFTRLDAIPDITRGSGALICLAKEVLPVSKTCNAIPASCI